MVAAVLLSWVIKMESKGFFFKITADTAALKKLQDELKRSEQSAAAAGKIISEELSKSYSEAARGLQSDRGQFVKAGQNAGAAIGEGLKKSNYSGIGRAIGDDISNGLKSSISGAKSSLSNIFQGIFQGIGQSAFNAITAAISAPIQGGFNFVGASVDQAKQIETLTTALKFVSGNSTEATTNMKFLREASDQLGYSLNVLIPGFNQLAASTKGTQLEGVETRNLFYSIAQAGRVLGLSNESIKNSLLAVSQMAGKGVISMEELRGQLGESLPSAIQIFARSMGVSVQKFTEMVGSGQVSADSLAKFSRQINKEMGSGVPQALGTAAAASNNLENQIAKLQETLGKGLEPATTAAAKFLAQTLAEVQNSTAFDTLNSEATKFADFLKENPKYAKALGDALSTLLEAGVKALVSEAEKLLKYLEENPKAVESAIAQIKDFAGIIKSTIQLCGEVTRTLADWDRWLGESNKRFNGGTDNLISGVKSFAEWSKSVLDYWGGIVDKMAQGTGMSSDLKQTGNERPDSKNAAIRDAIMGQESSGNPKAVNPITGALGLYQVLPSNLPSWSKAATGREVGRDEFLNDPKLQTKIVDHQMGTMLREAMKVSGGNENTAVRRVASEWYSGDPNLLNSTAPQVGGPSIRDYTNQVWERYKPIAAKLGNLNQSASTAPAIGGAVTDNQSASNRDARTASGVSGTSKGVSGVDFNAATSQGGTPPQFPIAGMNLKNTPITGDFGEDRGTHKHGGTDFAAPQGTPVLSALDGVITDIRPLDGAAGNTVEVTTMQGGKPIKQTFMHLSAMFGSVGSSVKAGQQIGAVGSTGRSSGPHLHYQVEQNGELLDPTKFLANSVSATGSNDSLAQQTANAAAEAKRLLEQRRATETAKLAQQRKERDRDIALARETQDADLASQIAKQKNPQMKSLLESQRSSLGAERQADDKITQAKDQLADYVNARSVKIQDKLSGGIDFSAAIANQQKYIASLEDLKKRAGEVPRIEFANKIEEETDKLDKAAEEQSLAVFDLQNQYESANNPAIEHMRQIQQITKTYDDASAKIRETVKAAKELAAVAPSAKLTGIAQRGEADLKRLDEGRARAIAVANAQRDKAEEQKFKDAQIAQLASDAEQRSIRTNPQLQTLQARIAAMQTIGGDTRNLQLQAGQLQESDRFQSQIEGLKALQIQGKISTTTLGDLLETANQLNSVNLENLRSQFSETREILQSGLFEPLKGFFTGLLDGTKSLGDAFRGLISSMLSSLANLAVNKLFSSLFGGLFGGGGGASFGLDIMKPVLNFATGGEVPALAGGGYQSGYGEISKALKREGSNAVLAALTPGELVLSVKQHQRFRELGINRVLNFANGGVVGGPLPNLRSGKESGDIFNLPITIQDGGSGIDPIKLQRNVQSFVQMEILRQKRDRGALSD